MSNRVGECRHGVCTIRQEDIVVERIWTEARKQTTIVENRLQIWVGWLLILEDDRIGGSVLWIFCGHCDRGGITRLCLCNSLVCIASSIAYCRQLSPLRKGISVFITVRSKLGQRLSCYVDHRQIGIGRYRASEIEVDRITTYATVLSQHLERGLPTYLFAINLVWLSEWSNRLEHITL